jgi:CheY-like chemotaxis protein
MEETLTPASEKSILVVDDDDEMRKLLDLSLTKEGFKVVLAVDGTDAAEKVRGRSFDLIITDLMMPGVGGYEFLRTLQAEGASSVPVFVISAGTMKRQTVEMIKQEANVVEFIPKPIPMAYFTGMLHRTLKTMPPELAARRAAGPTQSW